MTYLLAFQRTLDRLDVEAFGRLTAQATLDEPEARDLLDGQGDVVRLERATLETMLMVSATSALQRFIGALQMEEATGDPDEDDPAGGALEATVAALRQALTLLEDPANHEHVAELLAGIVEAWDRAATETAP